MLDNPMTFMSTFQLIICVYVLYCGITGKGQLFQDDNIHKDNKEKFKSILKKFALIFGPIGVAGALLDIQQIQPWGYILDGVFFLGILYVLYISFIMTDQYVKKQQKKNKSK